VTVLRCFSYLVGAALFAAVVGGVFGSAVGMVSPELVRSCAAPPGSTSLVRSAAALGMVLGLLLGVGAMGFSLLLVTVIKPRDR